MIDAHSVKTLARGAGRHIVILLLLVLPACTGALAPRYAEDGPFSQNAARSVFYNGYENLAEFYVEPVSMSRLGVEGLRGLGALDPALSVQSIDDTVILRSGNLALRSYAMPKPLDTIGWAELTVDAIVAAQSVSHTAAKASSENVYKVVFDSALDGLDEFTRYLDREEAGIMRASRDGFGGIGVTLDFDDNDTVRIAAILPGSPSSKAGLEVADQIVQVDAVPLSGLSPREVVELLRGKAGTDVTLLLNRNGVRVNKVVQRDHIIPPTVLYIRAGNVAVFRIASFNQDTTAALEREMAKAEADLGASMRGIVIDLRGNPGGLLDQSVAVANLFLNGGDIMSTKGRHPNSRQHFQASGRFIGHNLPLALVIDGNTASAGEVVAAALQDRGRASIIGATSYGKGSVQTVLPLPNEGEMTLTWATLFTPSGYTWNRVGVMPNVCTSNGSITASLGRGTPRAMGKGGEAARDRVRTLCPSVPRPDDDDLELAVRLVAGQGTETQLPFAMVPQN